MLRQNMISKLVTLLVMAVCILLMSFGATLASEEPVDVEALAMLVNEDLQSPLISKAGEPVEPESFEMQHVFVTEPTFANTAVLEELSNKPVIVSVLPGNGVISGIVGEFPGGPEEVLRNLLEAMGVVDPGLSLEIIGENAYDQEGLNVMSFRAVTNYGYPVAGGQVNLVYDNEAVYQVYGRIATTNAPEVEPPARTIEELQQEWEAYEVSGPYLYRSELFESVGEQLLPEQSSALFLLLGDTEFRLLDGHGEELFRGDWDPELQENWLYLTQPTDFFHLLIFKLIQNYVTQTYWDSETGSGFASELILMDLPINRVGLSNWTPIQQNWLDWALFHRFLRHPSRLVKEPSIIYSDVNSVGYNKEQGQRIWIEALAHTIWYDSKGEVSWKLSSYQPEVRAQFLAMNQTYSDWALRDLQEGRVAYDLNKVGTGSTFQPANEYSYLKGLGWLIHGVDPNGWYTLINLATYFRTYFAHTDLNDPIVLAAFTAIARSSGLNFTTVAVPPMCRFDRNSPCCPWRFMAATTLSPTTKHLISEPPDSLINS